VQNLHLTTRTKMERQSTRRRREERTGKDQTPWVQKKGEINVFGVEKTPKRAGREHTKLKGKIDVRGGDSPRLEQNWQPFEDSKQ